MNRLLRLLCPSEYALSVCDVSPADLRERHISAILADLDNTLVPWRGYDISPEVRAWLRAAENEGLKVCIVSNTRFPRRLRRLADELGVPFVNRVMKPRRGGFMEALKLLDCRPEAAVVVGDQVFTDILGGNRLGLHTILVKPLSRREFIGTKVSRAFERVLLWFFRKRGLLPCEGVDNASAAGTLV